MSALLRSQSRLTLAHLAQAWTRELEPENPNATALLIHFLKEDIANGFFDDIGARPGFYVVTRGGIPASIKGRDAVEFVQAKLASDYIVVTKEAVLDFARRREMPGPSWWTEVNLSSGSTLSPNDTPSDAAEPLAASAPKSRGRKPTTLNRTVGAMRADISSGSMSVDDLRNMAEKILASRFGVSRDTCRKARAIILSEMSK